MRVRTGETLDVLAAHGVAGFTGILFIGFFASAAWNGVSHGLFCSGALYAPTANIERTGRKGLATL